MDLTLTTDFASRLAEFLELEAEASAAYNAFVYRDAEQALEIRSFLAGKPQGEFSPPHAQALLQGERMVGALICLPGKLLAGYRLRMALEMKKAGFFDRDPQLSQRMQLAGRIFHKPQAGDFYLSRIAVQPAARGLGLGGILLEEFERLGAEAECTRYVFEVSTASEQAVSFYRRYGYRDLDRQRVDDPGTGRSMEYFKMALERAPSARPERFRRRSTVAKADLSPP